MTIYGIAKIGGFLIWLWKRYVCKDKKVKLDDEIDDMSWRAWEVFDTTTDVVDELGVLSKPISKYLTIGKTAVNVIDNVSNGKYLDATGNVIMSFVDCSIGLYIDVGVAIYETDFMQRRIAYSATQEYFNLQKQLDQYSYGSSKYNEIRKKNGNSGKYN